MKVVVAMSGGVDSSVAAALLVEQGHEVIGVHMKLHDAPENEGGHCCGLDDAFDARRVAGKLGIPFYVMNLQEAFQKAVIEDLARTYVAGATPNPCVQCNGVLKFSILYNKARMLGADALATGHYAQVDHPPDGPPVLRMAVDRAKDQTYFLHPIRAEVLARVWFPLGGLSKPEVREHARRFGLVTAEKPESMEVCFLPDDDHTGFVARQTPELDAAGEIVDEDGRVLGKHDAYYRYTIGQRRGLGLSGGPWFVLRVEPEARRVVVGPEERLMAGGLLAKGVNWLAPVAPGAVLSARVRHRGALLPCVVESVDPLRLSFRAPARAVTPGQSVVLYEGDVVIGGGYIVRADEPPKLESPEAPKAHLHLS